MFDTKDVLIYESGNGGDISISGNDIALTEQLFQQIYLRLFGGNVEAVTKGNEPAGEVRNDWWGNSLFFSQDQGKQFNSVTEKTLNETALNSAGRLKILTAVERDLSGMEQWASTTVDVLIASANKVVIVVQLSQPNQTTSTLNIIWDSLKKQVVLEYNI
jgi:phage gp46-like protein